MNDLAGITLCGCTVVCLIVIEKSFWTGIFCGAPIVNAVQLFGGNF